MQLRARGHDYTLTHISTTQFKNAVVNRCIYLTLCNFHYVETNTVAVLLLVIVAVHSVVYIA